MNEGLEYAKMIEIPTTEINVTFKKKRFSFRRKKEKDLKEEVISKINSLTPQITERKEEPPKIVQIRDVKAVKREKREVKINVVMVQFIIICALASTIFLTNIFWENSGINTFFRSVFYTQEIEDERMYSEFVAESPIKQEDVLLEEGTMTFGGKTSVYSPCKGVVSNVGETDGKITIEISHNSKFRTIISGAEYAYVEIGETVFPTVPVCFSSDELVTVCLYDGDTLIRNYSLEGGEIVWNV